MKLKVLIVDDSALMRKYLGEILEGGLEVELQTARDGADALARIQAWDPDVVTLDINMPVMDGLTCLAHIMTDFPRPVVMVSSLTERDALATLEALGLGAVDFVTKPGGTVSLNIREAAPEIVAKVRAAGRQARIKRLRRRARQPGAEAGPPPPPKISRPTPAPGGSLKLVLIGVSTGGPSTLEQILPALPADFGAPILVAQHMPGTFTRLFASRLDALCKLKVEEVQRRSRLQPGHVYIAQGDADVEVSRLGVGLVATSVPERPDLIWHPSVERMVATAAQGLEARHLAGVLLTGMGNDGAAAMTALRQAGGRTIAESEETAVIFGMPAELIALGGAEVVLPNQRIAGQLVDWMDQGGAGHGTHQA